MSLRIFVSHENHEEISPLKHSESVAIFEILELLWQTFQKQMTPYLVCVNMKSPIPADIVIISPRGIGVVEVKSAISKGKLAREFLEEHGRLIEVWCYVNGEKYIIPGKAKHDDSREVDRYGYNNPKEQVNGYRAKIWKRLVNCDMGLEYLPGPRQTWNLRRNLIQSAALFHGYVDIQELKPDVEDPSFKLLSPEDIVPWAAALALGEEDETWRPYLFTPDRMERIAKEVLNTIESKNLPAIMPDEKPWGQLNITQGEQIIRTYDLDRSEVPIGRGAPPYGISIPKEYIDVSRKIHAVLRRNLATGSITLQGYSNAGTSVGGAILELNREYVIGFGQTIILGPGKDKASCILKLEKPDPEASLTGTLDRMIQVTPLDGFRVELVIQQGTSETRKTGNLLPFILSRIHGKDHAFTELKEDQQLFNRVEIQNVGLELVWPNGASIHLSYIVFE